MQNAPALFPFPWLFDTVGKRISLAFCPPVFLSERGYVNCKQSSRSASEISSLFPTLVAKLTSQLMFNVSEVMREGGSLA